MEQPLLIKHCPTGIYPAWIPCAEALPDTARCVLATDLEGVYVAVRYGEWVDASTEMEFDSVITHWMEQPNLPENY
jgi:hypothetical protein